VRHRLFAIDIFARSAGIHENFAMLMVGYCDDDGVNVLAIENLFVVARGGDLFVDGLLRGDMTRIV